MTQANIEMHIDRLVLDGFSDVDRDQLGQALRRELERQFAEQGIPRAITRGGAMAKLTTGTVDVGPGADGDSIGTQLAKAVYGGLDP